jgi:predicted DNA-binding WGR domain protein
MTERTYLELSEDGGKSHKFYELTLDDKTVTVRFGRIGDSGQTQTKTFPSADKARTEATKKLSEKTKKGYAPAVMGVRQKRAVTRREIVSQKPTAGTKSAPVIWKFSAGSDRAFGIFVDEARCWLGNEAGSIYSLDHDGRTLDQFRLPDGVKCIVADDQWLYAGCDDGKVYDLGGKQPRVAYEIADDVDIFWLDIKDGVLGISDAAGNVMIVNHEDESQWKKQSKGRAGWMIRCDELGVYHGHSGGVTMYDWEDGREIWHAKTQGEVLFGWQEEATIYASTTQSKIHRWTKRGTDEKVYACDAQVFSCAASPDGKYVFGGDNCSSVYCFDEAGTRLWKLATGCGSACSMQFFRDRLYIVTTEGMLACIDASEPAIQAANEGNVPKAKTITAPKPVAVAQPGQVETTVDVGEGIVVEVYKEGTQLRVRVLSSGFHRDWHVQFPKDLRQEGAQYVCDEILQSGRGGFYRARGGIRRLVR